MYSGINFIKSIKDRLVADKEWETVAKIINIDSKCIFIN